MSSMRTSSYRRAALDHFEPEDVSDPQAQRRLRGHLEQIDYTAFASNKEVLAHMLGRTDAAAFQRLAVAAALARARWVKEALHMAEAGHELNAEQIAKLSRLRAAYDELTEAYEGMRRLVERGYLTYTPATS